MKRKSIDWAMTLKGKAVVVVYRQGVHVMTALLRKDLSLTYARTSLDLRDPIFAYRNAWFGSILITM